MVSGFGTSRLAPAAVVSLATALAVVLLSVGATAQRARPAAAVEAPPVSMTCPMHPEIVEERPGSCPLCKMNLVPVRLESTWTCPLHSVVSERAGGKCAICGRDLIQVTMAFTWSCLARPDISEIDRGTCPDGSAMIPKRTLRPHGNHNPQHGGQFFMAPDSWHHLEGVYPRERVFRLYLYDDYSRPLATDKLRQISGRLVTREAFDPVKRTTTEVVSVPLQRSSAGAYLEARTDRVTMPAQMTAKIRVKDGGPEYRFDFTFATLSKEPAPITPPPGNTTRRTPPPRPPAASTTRTTPATAPTPTPPVAVVNTTISSSATASLPVDVPENIPEILGLLQTRTTEIRALIDRGNFGAVFVPAFQAKDLAIALEGRLPGLAAEQRQRAEPAIRALVRTAWLLDAVGDVGNRDQLVTAYDAFASSVSDVTAAVAAR